MAAKASYIGREKIMDEFLKKAETPFFSLWVGKWCAERNSSNDFEKATEKLENQIKAFEESDNNAIFIIALHPEKKIVYKEADVKEAVVMYCQIRPEEASSYAPANISGANYQILEKLNSIESRINAMEAEEPEEEEEGEEMGSSEAVLIDKINGIVNSPLVSILMQFLNNKPVTALAGTDDLNDILETLFSKGVTVQHLKKLAGYPKEKISMLLTML